VIPFVEDHRNCLLIDLATPLGATENASLQAALKRAIQARYQLEDDELAVESLPSDANPRRILLYEAAEGGAGVLRQLLNPGALAAVAREALSLCHFDPETGEDLRRAPRAKEDCEAACYDCLMSYQNQRYHQLLDRQAIRDLLIQLRDATVETSPTNLTRSEHLKILMNQAGSALERSWLELLEKHNLRLPSHAQKLIEGCSTRPDFLYAEDQVAVYIDGPPHDFPERQERDAAQTTAMEDYGYTVVRFHHQDDWMAVIGKFPYVFGKVSGAGAGTDAGGAGYGGASAGAGASSTFLTFWLVRPSRRTWRVSSAIHTRNSKAAPVLGSSASRFSTASSTSSIWSRPSLW
jgi:very-short-patch-repair endonuclease